MPNAREETVVVPADLKGSILSFLERFHGISERTVFNDIHGFIRHQTPGRSGYAREFQESLTKPPYDIAVELRPCLEAKFVDIELTKMRHAYQQRGIVYKDDKRSMFSINVIPTTPGPTGCYIFDFEPEQVVDLFTHFIEKTRAGLRKKSIAGAGRLTCSRARLTSPYATSKTRRPWTQRWRRRTTGAATRTESKAVPTGRWPILMRRCGCSRFWLPRSSTAEMCIWNAGP